MRLDATQRKGFSDFMTNSKTMKKLFLFLFLISCVLTAQILPNLFSPFRLPDSKFRVDTINFHNGALKIQEYSIDANENASLQSIYEWQTLKGKFIKSATKAMDGNNYNYYESQFEFENGRPFQMKNFRRLIDQTLLEPAGKDSMGYENERLRFVYKVSENQNSNYNIEYKYDSIFGLKSAFLGAKPNNTTFPEMFEVQDFYKPNLPSFVIEYSESRTNKKLMGNRKFYYDSLDRLIYMVDSSELFDKMHLDANISIVYLGNTHSIDSIIIDEVLLNSFQVYKVAYNNMQKIAQVKVYKRTSVQPYRLESVFEVINPTSGISDQPNTKLKVSLFPNPAFDRLNFKSEKPIEAVEIYDLTGALVFKQEACKLESISIKELAAGTYLVKLMNQQDSVFKRLVKSQN